MLNRITSMGVACFLAGALTLAAAQNTPRYATPQGQIQGTARSPATGAAAIATEELVCRGGDMVRIDKQGEKATPGGNVALLTLYFQLAPGATDASGRGLVPSSCAFIGRAWVSGDPPGVRFETPSRTSEERSVRRMRHGSPPPTSGPADAEAMPDEITLPAYLRNPSHYWGFTVTRGPGVFLATRHELVKTTLVPANARAAVANRNLTVAKLHSVQVRPGIASARFRFIARPGASPTIDIGRQPPVVGRDGLKVLPDPTTMPVDPETRLDIDSPITWYVAETKQKGLRLEEEVDYHYIVTVPGDGTVPIQQSVGRFVTLREPIVVKVTFKRVHIIDDGDDYSDGEGAFTYCAGHLDTVQEMPAFASGTDLPADRVLVNDRWKDGPLTVAVEGIDDDAFGKLLRGGCTVDGPVSNATADRNVARFNIDTNSPSLAGRHASRSYQMNTPGGELTFSVEFEIDISRPAR